MTSTGPIGRSAAATSGLGLLTLALVIGTITAAEPATTTVTSAPAHLEPTDAVVLRERSLEVSRGASAGRATLEAVLGERSGSAGASGPRAPSPSPSSPAATEPSAPSATETPTASGSPTSEPSSTPATAPTTAPAPGPAAQSAPPAKPPAPTPHEVHEGDLTITTAGTVVDGVDVHGYVRILAPNVTIKNSIVRGRAGLTGSMALVQNTSSGLHIVDSELVAAFPTWGIDGFVGSNTTFTRVNIHGVVDSIKLTGGSVVIEDSWLHDNLYYASTPAGHDTHSDNVQIQAGSDITIRSTTLSGSSNAALMITQDAGAVSKVTFSGNHADNGACTINLAEKSYGPLKGLSFTGNTFGTGTKVDHCAILMPPGTAPFATVSGNRFTDGRAFAVTRGS